MGNEPIHRWHGAHHYSDKVHLFLVVFLSFGILTLLWSYFTLASVNVNKFNPLPSGAGKPTPSQAITPAFSPTSKPEPSATPTFSPSPSPTCTPRPACLDRKPPCYIAETENMCPPTPINY